MQGTGVRKSLDSSETSGQGRALRVTVVRALHFWEAVRADGARKKTTKQKKSRSRRRADDSYFPAMAIQLPNRCAPFRGSYF